MNQIQPLNQPSIIHRSPSEASCCSKCRKCRKQGDANTAIVPCRCFGFIHQECLMRKIASAEVTQSGEYPEYKQYICPKCSGSILFLPDFRQHRLAFYERNCEEMCEYYLNIGYIFICVVAILVVTRLLAEGEIDSLSAIITFIILPLRIVLAICRLMQDKFCTFYYGPVRRRQRQETEIHFIPT